MSDQPKTGAELLALPIRGGFGSTERIIDGRKITVPVHTVVRAFWVGEDTTQRATDADGNCWALCQDEQGWFRKRVLR